MREYGLGYWELLQVPIRAFWLLARNINRLKAQDDMRSLRVLVAPQIKDGVSSLSESLVLEIDQIGESTSEDTSELDREGLHALKAFL
ncbi:hypothetical protein [Inquilinus sp. OTU3971]|uniref:hypothetical protein n=1 Tax=Inquilinus sp. OTU3971 TaxID=3043855 RepID=UPI00313DC235